MVVHDVLQHCLQEAAKGSGAALACCMDSAIAALQHAETQTIKVAERDTLAQAWRQLQTSKPVWLARYPSDLLAAFAAGEAAGEAAAASPSPPGRHWKNSASGGLDAFSLVDDADVTQSIETSRLLQTVLPMLEQSLAELDTLISSAQGLPNVQPERNPLRPEVFTRVLQAMMAQSTPDAAMLAIWSRQLAVPLGKELKRIYEKTITRLELAQVPAVAAARLDASRPAHASSVRRPRTAAPWP